MCFQLLPDIVADVTIISTPAHYLAQMPTWMASFLLLQLESFSGVWEENIWPWNGRTSRTPIHPHLKNIRQSPSTQEVCNPQAYKSLSVLSSQFHKLAVLLGWKSELDIVQAPTNKRQDFVSKTFCYTWVSKMTGKNSDVHSLYSLSWVLGCRAIDYQSSVAYNAGPLSALLKNLLQ